MRGQNKPLREKSQIDFEKLVLHNLHVMSEILQVAHTIDEVLQFTARIFEKIGFSHIRIWLYNQSDEHMHGGYCNHVPLDFFKKYSFPLVRQKTVAPRITEAIRTKKPYINSTPRILQGLLKELQNPLVITTTLEFPLIAGREFLGLIGVDTEPKPLPVTEEEADKYLMPLVNHIALTLARVIADQRLHEANDKLKEKVATTTAELREKNKQLKHLANHDEMTGLPNRRGFNKQLEKYFSEATNKHPLTLAMIDVDYFKQINDTHGHVHGDSVIQKIGHILATTTGVDYAARYAGDEFVVLLTGQKFPDDKKILERICRRVKRDTDTTLSIGAARHPAPGISTSLALIRRADDALYHAKHTGRNRVACAHEPGEQVTSFVDRKKALQSLEAYEGVDVVRYVQQLEIIREINEIVQSSEADTDLVQGVMRILKQHFGFLRLRMYSLEDEALECWYAMGIAHRLWSTLVRPLHSTTLAPTTCRMRQVVNLATPAAVRKGSPISSRLLGSQACLGIPLMVQRERVTGVMVCDYDPTSATFDDEHYQFFLTIGSHIALALERVWLLCETKENNRLLEERVTEATAQIQEYTISLEARMADNITLQKQTEKNHFEFVKSLITTIESKDTYTSSHSARVTYYALKLAQAMHLSPKEMEDIKYGALLHDIGKITIDQNILNKNTPLTDDEVRLLATHPETGYHIVKGISFLKAAAPYIRHHHERWDGRGYPDRLAGLAIPLGARIVNIADCFDAMVTRRSYGRTFPLVDALRELRRESGRQFDPILARTFIKELQNKHIIMLNDK